MQGPVQPRRGPILIRLLSGIVAAGILALLGYVASAGTVGPLSRAADTTTSSTTDSTSTDSTSSSTSSTTSTTAPAEAPRNTSPPTISGTPNEGSTLTANPGTWTGVPPITYRYQWLRCDASGNNCAAIVGATSQTYAVTSADVGHALRAQVTASDASGGPSGVATSAATAVGGASGPAGQIKLSNGKISIPVSSVSPPARLIVDGVRFSPRVVTSRRQAVTVRVHVSDTRGFVVRGALVFVRSTPLVTSTPAEQVTNQAGYVTLTSFPKRTLPLKPGYHVQFFVRTRREGDSLLAGVSSRRLVQVATR